MKKLLFLVPIAAVALASCSSDEQIAQSPALTNAQELTIRPVVEGTTRTITTDANFAGFTVEANITNGGDYAFWKEGTTVPPTQASDAAEVKNSLTLAVSKDATSGKWESLGGDKWYWSSKNAEASFTGYTSKGSITVPETVGNQEDVLVAFNKGAASSFDNGVPMLFRHVLSQIVIKADNKDADVRQIKVAAVRIHNFGKTNTLTLPNSETTAEKFSWWSAENTNGYKPWANNPATQTEKWTYYKGAVDNTYKYNANGATITLNASAQEITFAGPVLMLPQTNAAAAATDLAVTGGAANGKAYIDILVQVQNLESSVTTDDAKAIFPKINVAPSTGQTLSDQTFAWVAVPVDIAWAPGYKYTYVLHFSKDGIGKASPDEEGGDPDPGNEPGEEIVDNPVPLYFTVTIDEWNDAAAEEKNL